MAYGRRTYSVFYQQRTNTKIEVEIHQNLYVGADGPMLLSNQPAIMRIGPDGDKYTIIKGSECIINLVVTQADDYSWLYTNDDRKFKVIIKLADATWWTGFVLTDQFIEEQSPVRILQIVASDQLALLNVRPYTFGSPAVSPTGYAKIIAVLANILSKSTTTKTGLGLNIRCAMNLYEDNMLHDDHDDPLDQAYVNQDLWINQDGTAADCRTVIEDILKPFQCRIFQSTGVWWVQRISDLADASIDYREFDSNGSFVGNLSYSPQVSTLIKLATGTLTFNSGWRERTVQVDYGLRPSLIPSFKLSDSVFTSFNPVAISGWTNTGAWNTLRAEYGNIIWAITVGFAEDHSTRIELPGVDITDAFTYNLAISCGRIQTSAIAPQIDCNLFMEDGAVPGSFYTYNDTTNTWVNDDTPVLTQINFPKIASPDQLVKQAVSIVAPPVNGKMYLRIYTPYRGFGGTVDSWFYFNDIEIKGLVDPESDRLSDQTFTDFITDETNFIPEPENLRITDGLGDDTLIPYYKGFLKTGAGGSIGTNAWEKKSLIGTSYKLPLISHTVAPFVNGWITNGWEEQFYIASRRYDGPFRGMLYFHQVPVVDTINYLVNDMEIDLKRGHISGSFLEILPEWTPGTQTLALVLKTRGGGLSGNGSNGLIPQPGGLDGQLQFKTGGDFDGTTGITFDGTRILKGGTKPLIEYHAGTASVAAGPQTVTFDEPFLAGDDYAMIPIWGLDADGQKMDIIPYNKTITGFDVDCYVAVTFDYVAIIKR